MPIQRFNLKKYVQVLNGKVVDTSLLLPHVECYYIEDDANSKSKLFAEMIDGSSCYLGIVVKESNELNDLTAPLEFPTESK